MHHMMQAAKKAGGYTAWCDKGLAYQLLQGRTGNGIDDLFTPEVKGEAVPTTALCNGIATGPA